MKNDAPISYRIKEQSLIARIAAWKLSADAVAIVIGNCIHLHNVKSEDFLQNRRWFKHECCHIRQFQRHGFFSFVCKYLWESLRHGYYNNKYEVEARAAEVDD
ncbi:MAG: DUF4157 domain-containing protein [Chitinophagaceae bacterium]|nr:MAG: DUF4157 domain-containing protein [Chitinophagaceae bacterium]